MGRKNKLPPTFSASGSGMAGGVLLCSILTIVGFAAHTPHAADDVEPENDGARSKDGGGNVASRGAIQ